MKTYWAFVVGGVAVTLMATSAKADALPWPKKIIAKYKAMNGPVKVSFASASVAIFEEKGQPRIRVERTDVTTKYVVNTKTIDLTLISNEFDLEKAVKAAMPHSTALMDILVPRAQAQDDPDPRSPEGRIQHSEYAIQEIITDSTGIDSCDAGSELVRSCHDHLPSVEDMKKAMNQQENQEHNEVTKMKLRIENFVESRDFFAEVQRALHGMDAKGNAALYKMMNRDCQAIRNQIQDCADRLQYVADNFNPGSAKDYDKRLDKMRKELAKIDMMTPDTVGSSGGHRWHDDSGAH